MYDQLKFDSKLMQKWIEQIKITTLCYNVKHINIYVQNHLNGDLRNICNILDCIKYTYKPIKLINTPTLNAYY